MSKIIQFVLIYVILYSVAFSQGTGRLRGFVTDSTNGEALAYSNIFIEELKVGASTDDKGFFIISGIPGGKTYTVKISYVGYENKILKAAVSNNSITHLNIKLNPSSLQLKQVEKIGERVIEKNSTDIGLTRISIKELEVLPKGIETDVLRSLQYLPGVRSTGDISARYYVRGGASNQNMVLLNGVPLYNPFHALGIFSVVDPDMINNIEFFKGGFTSEFGGRLSSVLKLVTKDGNKNKLGFKANASFLSLKTLFEGPIPYGSFIMTARKSYSNAILRKFVNNQNAPFDFYDLSFKLNYSNPDFIGGSKFVVHSFISGDKLDYNNPLREDFNWSNNIFGIQWFKVYDVPLYSEFNLAISQFSGQVNPNLSNVLSRDNKLSDVSLDAIFTYLFDNKNEFIAGFNIHSIKTKYLMTNKLGSVADYNNRGSSLVLFTKYKLMSISNVGIDVGTRFNFITLTHKQGLKFEPRVSASFLPYSNLTLKAAWGIYQQEISTLSSESEVISLFEPWIITPDYLKPANSTHYSAGFDYFPIALWNIQLEGYIKKMNNLPILNPDKQRNSDPDFVSGHGESYGIELLNRLSLSPFNITASYALSWSYLTVNNWTYYPKYDSRHTANLIVDLNLGAGWSTAVTWIFSSGLPFTPFTGFYDKLFFDDFHSGNFIFNSYSPYAILGDRNILRMPTYHRMDFTLSKDFNFSFMKLGVDFSIINVYNRKNIFYYNFKTGERVDMLPILPTFSIKAEL